MRSALALLPVFALCLLLVHCGPPAPRPEAMLADACAFLWAQQGDDGGWHSETHGLLKGGQAWTPFVLHALLSAPAEVCPPPPTRVAQALDFIRRHTNAEGVLGLSDPDVLEYPNYSTAYALLVLARHGAEADTALVGKMTAYLVGQQFADRRGFGPADPAYGSWGFGEQRLPPGRTGHVDLSHTRRVLQALRAAGHDDPETYRNAEVFLRLVQKHPRDTRLYPSGEAASSFYDGGFYASPVVPSVNKSASVTGAPPEVPVYQSYATTTGDGLLALRAAGIDAADERVQAAARWLRDHPTLAYPEGMNPDHPARWHEVLFFYHLAVRAEAYRALDEPGDWRTEIAHLLAGRQRDDGSFANPFGAPNKEDDPLLATALVVLALHPAPQPAAGR